MEYTGKQQVLLVKYNKMPNIIPRFYIDIRYTGVHADIPEVYREDCWGVTHRLVQRFSNSTPAYISPQFFQKSIRMFTVMLGPWKAMCYSFLGVWTGKMIGLWKSMCYYSSLGEWTGKIMAGVWHGVASSR